jgi:hypothetical protein
LIRRVHDDESIPLQDRVVALLILLYAQPLIKIARLTVADIVLPGSAMHSVTTLAGEHSPACPWISAELSAVSFSRATAWAPNAS